MIRPAPGPIRLRPVDVVLLGGSGLRTRPLRAVLAALGIAVGVAAMVAVVGISVSSSAQLDRQLERLGTNLLRVSPAPDLQGNGTELPTESVRMIRRIPPVRDVSATAQLDVGIYRNPFIPSGRTGGLSVVAADHPLLSTVGAELATGSWLADLDDAVPVVVLGATAARQLDIHEPGRRVWLMDLNANGGPSHGRWGAVAGILRPVALAPELDRSAIVGWPAARTYLGSDGHPATIYVRTGNQSVLAVADVLPRTAKPSHPDEVRVSRPSDAIAAQRAAGSAFTGLLVGLGGVALVVGGLGVGNIMVISVLERRAEIGLRRALGATRRQIRGQFLAEALLLSLLGGVAGVVAGTLVTAVYATRQGWPVVVPPWTTAAGLLATLVIGGVAGLYPAVRASRQRPAQALAHE